MVINKSISHTFAILFIVIFGVAATFRTLDIRPAQAAGIRFVTPEGTGNCNSWAEACPLETALAGAVSGDEIWAAAGTYKPTTGIDRNATFHLQKSVAIYGGFAGVETDRNQRNWTANLTILSGDIGTIGDWSDNTFHVVTGSEVDSSSILDGFTVTAGNSDANGGGMLISFGSPTLMNLIFLDNNAASLGGGIYNDGSSPSLTNVTFTDNKANWGGGMNNYASNPTLTNVTFAGNTAQFAGGMIAWNGSNPTLINVTFSLNKAAQNGGGMAIWETSSATLTNVTISGNTALLGGGMYTYQSSNPILSHVTFTGNTSTSFGGGMYNSGGSPKVRNAIFWNNTAASGEAQVYNESSTPILSDSVFQDGCPAGGTCSNIITTNPLLGTLGDYGGLTQTIPLLPGSSAVDAGNDSICPATDQRGITRPQGAHCDIGAFEVVNNPPTLSLSNVTITLPENSDTSSGIQVADITIIDEGIGSNILNLSGPDAALFEIVSGKLLLKPGTPIDFEIKPSLNVTIEVNDTTMSGGPKDTQSLTIAITDVNETPTDIILSNSTIAENSTINTIIGILSSIDPDTGNTFSYSLVAGSGDANNISFNISGSSLRTSAVLDFEAQTSYSVRVRTTDQGGLSVEKAFIITVTNTNEQIYLSFIKK